MMNDGEGKPKHRYLGEADDDDLFWQGRDGSWLTAGEVRAMDDEDQAMWKVKQGYICGASLSGGWITEPGYCERSPDHLEKGLKHKAHVGCWPDGYHDEYWGKGAYDPPTEAG